MMLLLNFLLLPLVSASAHLQSWNEQTYLNEAHTITCNSTSANISFSSSDQLTWTKLGREGQIETDRNYQLVNDSGVVNMKLTIRSVTLQTGGIYFCTVRDSNGERLGRVVKGLNAAGYLPEDLLEKYRVDIIRGVITAASVFVIVVGICIIDHFRYKSDEQKNEIKERREDRGRGLEQSENGGIDNIAMQDGDYETGKHNYLSAKSFDSNTHL